MVDVMIIVGAVAVGFVILSIGGGFGYWFWLSTRPKKMTWKAYVYQLGDGVIPPDRDKKGNILANYKLSGLVPYTTDVIEKVDKKSGATHYWLQSMKKATPVVTADCVENWGKSGKWVRVLLEGDTVTLIKSGYDTGVAKQLFKPMPHDRINMIKTEVQERKERIENTKDILAQITPFIVVGIAMLGLVAIVYFESTAGVKIAELNREGAEVISNSVQGEMALLLQARGCIVNTTTANVPVREDPPEIQP